MSFTGSQWGILGWFIRRHQLVRYSRQACHYYAKGHTTCKKNPRRESLDCSLPVAPLVFTNITYRSSPFTRKIYMYIKYHTTKTFRNSSYNFSQWHQQEKTFFPKSLSFIYMRENRCKKYPYLWKMCSNTAAQLHHMLQTTLDWGFNSKGD